jgi:hypothetical protein
MSTETQEMTKRDLFRAVRTEAERNSVASAVAPAVQQSEAATSESSPVVEKVTLF